MNNPEMKQQIKTTKQPAAEKKLSEDQAAWIAKARERKQNVVIVGIDIPFGQCVGLLVKLALAAIPAGIMIYFVYTFVGSIIFGLLSHI